MAEIVTIWVDDRGGLSFVMSGGLKPGNALQMVRVVEDELQRRIARAEIEAEQAVQASENANDEPPEEGA